MMMLVKYFIIAIMIATVMAVPAFAGQFYWQDVDSGNPIDVDSATYMPPVADVPTGGDVWTSVPSYSSTPQPSQANAVYMPYAYVPYIRPYLYAYPVFSTYAYANLGAYASMPSSGSAIYLERTPNYALIQASDANGVKKISYPAPSLVVSGYARIQPHEDMQENQSPIPKTPIKQTTPCPKCKLYGY